MLIEYSRWMDGPIGHCHSFIVAKFLAGKPKQLDNILDSFFSIPGAVIVASYVKWNKVRKYRKVYYISEYKTFSGE
jgi:hypothetical protein